MSNVLRRRWKGETGKLKVEKTAKWKEIIYIIHSAHSSIYGLNSLTNEQINRFNS